MDLLQKTRAHQTDNSFFINSSRAFASGIVLVDVCNIPLPLKSTKQECSNRVRISRSREYKQFEEYCELQSLMKASSLALDNALAIMVGCLVSIAPPLSAANEW